MEKTFSQKLMLTKTRHEFYCDQPDKYEIGNGLELSGDYCKECGMKRINDAIILLGSKGFDIDYSVPLLKALIPHTEGTAQTDD